MIAPQSFKGSLSAQEVAQAMAMGIKRVAVDAETIMVPMADGGEGTVEALTYGTHGQIVSTEVTGPLGGKAAAKWGILGDRVSAVYHRHSKLIESMDVLEKAVSYKG